MVDEFEDACDTDILRRAGGVAPEPDRAAERPRTARLVARLYAGVSAPQRVRLLAPLLRPLGPLALVAVASGAFAGLVGRAAASRLDDLGRFSRGQVFELVRFVEQANPQALEAVARVLAENRAELNAFAAASSRLLARLVGLREPVGALEAG